MYEYLYVLSSIQDTLARFLLHDFVATDRDTVLALRDRYRRAYTSYLTCVRALAKAVLQDERPTQELLEQEASSYQEVSDARAALLDAIR